MNGSLTLIASPIGNLGDISERTKSAIEGCELVFAEDARVTGKLLEHLGCKRPFKTLNEHTTEDGLKRYVALLEEGTHACLITDAGTPGISDPGARFVDLCYDAEVRVDAIPGPSAVTLALSLSGFYAQRFAFLGFLGRKASAIRGELEPFIDSPFTLVLFESPFRVDALLEVASEVFGPRRVAICRELTKIHQEVVRTTLDVRPSPQEMMRKGEFTVVIEGHRRKRSVDSDSW